MRELKIRFNSKLGMCDVSIEYQTGWFFMHNLFRHKYLSLASVYDHQFEGTIHELPNKAGEMFMHICGVEE